VVGSKLFVGNLAWSVGDQDLWQVFESFGDIHEVKLVTDRETGQSRGFGFVTFASAADAEKALEAMDGQNLNGRAMRVSIAESRPHAGGGERRGRDSAPVSYSSDRGYNTGRRGREW
jgi:RNA recognition motif-containing protein